MKEEKFNYILLLLCIIGAWGIIFPLNPLVFWDQCIYILHAKYLSGFEVGYNELNFRSPLLSLLTVPIAYMEGSVILYKIFSVLWALAFPISSFYLFKDKLNGRREKVLFCSLILLNGLLQYESKFFLTDIPSLVLLIFSFHFLRLEKSYNPYLAGLLCGLGILMRLGNISLIPIFIGSILLKKDWKLLFKFSVCFILTLLPYQAWLYSHHENIFQIILQARLEGMRNAKYSFLKIIQIFQVFGIFSLTFAALGLYLKRYYKLAWVLLFTIIVIPYNPENYRFLLILIPLMSFSILSLYQYLGFKWKKIITVIVLLETIFLHITWRQKLSFIKPEVKSKAQLLSVYIKTHFKNIPFIASSFLYPDLAFFTDKRIIPLTRTYANAHEFSYVDKSVLKERHVLVLSNNKTMPLLSYFKNNSNFVSRGEFEEIHFFEYKGGLKVGYEQYSAIRLLTHFYWGYYGKGFLELDNKENIKQFLYIYRVSPDFIDNNKLFKCGIKQKITMNNFKELKIVNKSEQGLIVEITPKKLGHCKNIKSISFKVQYSLINNFD